MNKSSNERSRNQPSQPDRDPKRSGGNADQNKDRDQTQSGRGDQTQGGDRNRDGQRSKQDPHKRNTTTQGGGQDDSQKPHLSVNEPSPNRGTTDRQDGHRDDEATSDQAKRPGGTGDASHASDDEKERPAR